MTEEQYTIAMEKRNEHIGMLTIYNDLQSEMDAKKKYWFSALEIREMMTDLIEQHHQLLRATDLVNGIDATHEV